MKKINLMLVCLAFLAGVLTVSAAAQPKIAADYKLTRIKVVPFEKATGELEKELLATGDDRSFFNDLSKTYLILVEVTGEAGSFVAGRKIEIIATEGKRVKARKLEQIDLLSGTGGKVFMPLWIDAPLCDSLTVTARIVGQKTPSKITRKLEIFNCGE